MAALRALDAAGFTRLAGIKGGYNAFTREFDAKLVWRHTDSAYDGQGGRDMWREVDGSAAFSGDQTTGLNHGNSFERMDNVRCCCAFACVTSLTRARCSVSRLALQPDNLFPKKDPVKWIDVAFSDSEIAEAAAILAGRPAQATHAAAAPAAAPVKVEVPAPVAAAPAVAAPAAAAAAEPSAAELDTARKSWVATCGAWVASRRGAAAKAQHDAAAPAPAQAQPAAPSAASLDAARQGWAAAAAAAAAAPAAAPAAHAAPEPAAAEAAPPATRAEAAAPAGPGQGEARGEYVLFRF